MISSSLDIADDQLSIDTFSGMRVLVGGELRKDLHVLTLNLNKKTGLGGKVLTMNLLSTYLEYVTIDICILIDHGYDKSSSVSQRVLFNFHKMKWKVFNSRIAFMYKNGICLQEIKMDLLKEKFYNPQPTFWETTLFVNFMKLQDLMKTL